MYVGLRQLDGVCVELDGQCNDANRLQPGPVGAGQSQNIMSSGHLLTFSKVWSKKKMVIQKKKLHVFFFVFLIVLILFLLLLYLKKSTANMSTKVLTTPPLSPYVQFADLKKNAKQSRKKNMTPSSSFFSYYSSFSPSYSSFSFSSSSFQTHIPTFSFLLLLFLPILF